MIIKYFFWGERKDIPKRKRYISKCILAKALKIIYTMYYGVTYELYNFQPKTMFPVAYREVLSARLREQKDILTFFYTEFGINILKKYFKLQLHPQASHTGRILWKWAHFCPRVHEKPRFMKTFRVLSPTRECKDILIFTLAPYHTEKEVKKSKKTQYLMWNYRFNFPN